MHPEENPRSKCIESSKFFVYCMQQVNTSSRGQLLQIIQRHWFEQSHWPQFFSICTSLFHRGPHYYICVHLFSRLIPVTSIQNWYVKDFLEPFIQLSMDHSKDNFRSNYFIFKPNYFIYFLITTSISY